MKSVSNGNSENDIKKLLFLYVLDGLIFLAVDLGDNFFDTVGAVTSLSAWCHFVNKFEISVDSVF